MLVKFKNGEFEIDLEKNNILVFDTKEKEEDIFTHIDHCDYFCNNENLNLNAHKTYIMNNCWYIQQTPKQVKYLTKENLKDMRYIVDGLRRSLIDIDSCGNFSCGNYSQCTFEFILKEKHLKWSTGLFDEPKSFRKDGR